MWLILWVSREWLLMIWGPGGTTFQFCISKNLMQCSSAQALNISKILKVFGTFNNSRLVYNQLLFRKMRVISRANPSTAISGLYVMEQSIRNWISFRKLNISGANKQFKLKIEKNSMRLRMKNEIQNNIVFRHTSLRIKHRQLSPFKYVALVENAHDTVNCYLRKMRRHRHTHKHTH